MFFNCRLSNVKTVTEATTVISKQPLTSPVCARLVTTARPELTAPIPTMQKPRPPTPPTALSSAVIRATEMCAPKDFTAQKDQSCPLAVNRERTRTWRDRARVKLVLKVSDTGDIVFRKLW